MKAIEEKIDFFYVFPVKIIFSKMDFSNLVNHPTAGYLVGNDIYKCNIVSYERYPRNVHILRTRMGEWGDNFKYFKYDKKNDYWYKVNYDGIKFSKGPRGTYILNFNITKTFLDPHF